MAEQDFAGQFADAICGGQAACCQKVSLAYHSESDCRAAGAQLVQELHDDATKASLAYDPGAAGDCVAFLRQSYAECQAPLDQELGAKCANVYHGNKGQGQACTGQDCGRSSNGTLLQCAAKTPASESPSSCEAVEGVEVATGLRGKAGDVCRATCTTDVKGGFGCDVGGDDAPDGVTSCFTNDGLYCDSGHCVAQKNAGGVCAGDTMCATGLVCSAPGDCAPTTPGCGKPGVCQAAPKAGDACLFGSDCGDGGYCDDATKKCATRKKLGDACAENLNQCASQFCADGVCEDERDLTRPSACAGANENNR